MKAKPRIIFLTLTIVTLIGITLLSTSCEPPLTLNVENQTTQAITMYVQGYRYFDVPPNSTVENSTVPIIYDKYFIEGLNQEGQTIYSRAFDRSQYVVSYKNFIARNYTLEIVITPSEQDPYLPLEVENRTSYELYIHVDLAPIGQLKPHTSLRKRSLPGDLEAYSITADTYDRSPGGDVIYNKTFSRNDLEKAGWKIVITDSDISFR